MRLWEGDVPSFVIEWRSPLDVRPSIRLIVGPLLPGLWVLSRFMERNETGPGVARRTQDFGRRPAMPRSQPIDGSRNQRSRRDRDADQ